MSGSSAATAYSRQAPGAAHTVLWEDVDLEAGTLTVRRALQRVKERGLVLVEPKSFAGRRTPRPAPAVDRRPATAPGGPA